MKSAASSTNSAPHRAASDFTSTSISSAARNVHRSIDASSEPKSPKTPRIQKAVEPREQHEQVIVDPIAADVEADREDRKQPEREQDSSEKTAQALHLTFQQRARSTLELAQSFAKIFRRVRDTIESLLENGT